MGTTNKVSVETIVRTIMMVITLINQILVMTGKNPLPFAEEDIYTVISTVASILVMIWVWWKNNSFTSAAIKADEIMKKLKSGNSEDDLEIDN